jgi:hypothetical protein
MRYRVLLGALAGLAVVALGAAVAVAAPAEDGFARHTAIEANFPGTTTFDSTNAPATISRTFDGQSCSSAGTDSHVVWFKWKATESSGIFATTVGSSYDTVLYVFRGGKLIGCNDDEDLLGPGCGSSEPRCSRVAFTSMTGPTYYFSVAAYDGTAGGDTHLNLIVD